MSSKKTSSSSSGRRSLSVLRLALKISISVLLNASREVSPLLMGRVSSLSTSACLDAWRTDSFPAPAELK